MPDFWSALQQRRARQPGAPVITYLDPSRSERTELSAVTLENAAAKIANALRDAYDLDAGTTVGLALPQHWQRAAWCAGAWTAGCAVVFEPPDLAAADLLVVSEDAVSEYIDATSLVVAVSMHPFGLPISRDLPGRVTDSTLAVRMQPDAYLFDTATGDEVAVRQGGVEWTQQQVWLSALDLARRWGLERDGRLLVTGQITGWDALLACLAVPIAGDGSVVLVNGDVFSEALVKDERISAVAAPSR